MISLEDFHQDFLQSILSDAESRGLLKPLSFFENVCETLISTGDLTNNYTAAEYTKIGMEVYGYDYDKERHTLSLLAHQFFQDNELQTLTKTHIDTKFKRLRTFYEKCLDGFYREMEESYDSYDMAYNILEWSKNNLIRKLRLILLSDGKATRNLSELPSEFYENLEIEFRVIDIEYLYKCYLSDNRGGDFDVDVNLPALNIKTNSDEYLSYLSYVPGDTLVDIYEQFGQKLFEQNVRTFLQFRGNVNKGLRNTIEYRPEMFFAFNNGITATATDVVQDNAGNIIKIKNFQIVNGGQTTSAIYAAKVNSKLDVSDVFVQMKLSIVKNKDKQNSFVSDVSEYANTQNKVNQSDFFSNSPFHKEFKKYSNIIWVSATGGSQRRTHWFYERVRGEYLNGQAYLKPSEKRQFQLENPKSQLLDKTFLSKSENSFMQRPDIVTKGAQYSFSHFAENITKQLEKDNLIITEAYFKESIAKVIVFKTVEKMVSNADWFDGGLRAPTVAYTIAYLAYKIQSLNKFLNFELIWENQAVSDDLLKILNVIGEKVYESITNPPEGNANASQWCKKLKCWEVIKSLNLDISFDDKLLKDRSEYKYDKKEEKKDKRLDNEIEMQAFVVNLNLKEWKKISDYYNKPDIKKSVSPMKIDILDKHSSGQLKLPSPKQATILYNLYYTALDEGFIL